MLRPGERPWRCGGCSYCAAAGPATGAPATGRPAAAQIADGSPRMVLAVDVPQAAIAWSGRGAEGALTVGLVRRDLVSIHVDDTPGDQLARLSWYDATEAAHVLDNVS